VSRLKQGAPAIWQRQFWEHTIRDEKDYRIHMDYIHYNPVKHGLVKRVSDWEWSSFHRYGQDWVAPTQDEVFSMDCEN
jgi:putative transposase